ncbi:ABC transporter permease subunit [Desulfothermus okinawensis]
MFKNLFRKSVCILSILTLFFIISPIIHIFIKISAKSLISTLIDKSVWSSIFLSIGCALSSTILGCIMGIPLAYLLSKNKLLKANSLVEGIINLPVAIPHVAVGIALLSLFNDRTLLGSFFNKLHISFVDTAYGIIIAMLFVSLSFIISSSLSGFDSIEPEMEMVARTLGASRSYTFFHITFPLAFPSILRGAILAFARSISEVGAILIIAYYPKTAPILMYERFEEYGLKSARPVTVIVILVCVAIFSMLMYFSKKYARRQYF